MSSSTPIQKIEAKKSLGQHFLNNPRVPKLMADAGNVGAGDVVLEIGPGTGMLTRELLSRGATVIGLEADNRGVESLKETFTDEISAKKLILFHEDARTFPLKKLGVTEHKYKVVANIPYYLSGKLFRTFLETDTQPSDLVFLVQKEVAERIARDKKESLLSLGVGVYGTPKYVQTIKKGNFTPSPKVDSAIIAVLGISHTSFANLDEKEFFEILHAGFGSKRKQLIGNLTKLLSREVLTQIFSEIGIPLDARGEDIKLATWLTLARAITVHK